MTIRLRELTDRPHDFPFNYFSRRSVFVTLPGRSHDLPQQLLLLMIRLRELTGRPRDLTAAFQGFPIFMIDLPIPSRDLPIAIPEVTPALREFKIPLRDVTTAMHVFEIPLLHADNALHNLNFSLHKVTNALGRGREPHSVIEESLESIYFFSYKNLINFSSMSLESNYLSSEQLVEVYAQAESPFALLFQTHESNGAHSKQKLPASLFLPHFSLVSLK